MEPTTVVHRREDHDVLIDRTTPWGNPFTHGPSSLAKWRVETRAEAIKSFQRWVLYSEDPAAEWIRDHLSELQGKRLGCWCYPKDCHGRILAALVDGHSLVDQESFPF